MKFESAAELKAHRARRHTLPKVGYFSGGFPDDGSFPSAASQVDETWDAAERETLIAYLEAGEVIASCRGMSNCRICQKWNGNKDLSDGTHVWPEGYSHYLRDHGVKPPQEFIDHALSNLNSD